MSVGLFIGIIPSYLEEAEDSAKKLVEAINLRLKELNFSAYSEPDEIPDVYDDSLFGRSELDHHSANSLAALAYFAEENKLDMKHLSLLTNPYRVVFLPLEFNEPFETGHNEEVFDEQMQVWAGSSQKLLEELSELAPMIGIPLSNTGLSDDIATKINEFEMLSEDDNGELAEDERTAWLVMYEGARLSVENKVALSLAG